MSRQRLWQQKMQEAGKCRQCGQAMGKSLYKSWCQKCGDAQKLRRREKTGCKPWKRGGKGRPPNSERL
jgi:hypothetical protein